MDTKQQACAPSSPILACYFVPFTASVMNTSDLMIELKYQLFNSSEITVLEIPYTDFFDPIDPDETYELDGIQKYSDLSSYVEVNPKDIQQIQASVFGEYTTQTFDENGGLLQHTIYNDGLEMIVIQNLLDSKNLHSVKLLKSKGGNWHTDSIVVINDEVGSVKTVL